jgi:tetratricopeptide (TPR) repeat protein
MRLRPAEAFNVMGTALMVAALAATLVTDAGAARTDEKPGQALTNERSFCTGRPDTPWDVQIRSCTALILSEREPVKDRAIAHNNRGIAYYGEKDYDRAIADYDAAVSLDPGYATGYYNRGNAWQVKGDYDRAVRDYDQALALQANFSAVYYNRGNTYRAKGEIDRAMADYDVGLELFPNSARTYGNRGIAYYIKKDYDRAITDYDAAIRLDPDYANAYGNRALAYAAKGAFDRAIADYDAALRLRPGAIDYNNRGLAYAARNDFDRAIADYDAALRLDPALASAHANRGEAYRVEGDDDRAVADFAAAIALDPANSVAYFGRGRILLYRGALADAERDLAWASELAPRDAHYALWLELAVLRNHRPSRLADIASRLDMKAWPAPLVRLFLGDATPGAVLAAAADLDPGRKSDKLCEAEFFSGAAALRDGRDPESARLFRRAAQDCPKSFFESQAANIELKALGLAP